VLDSVVEGLAKGAEVGVEQVEGAADEDASDNLQRSPSPKEDDESLRRKNKT
jgi:hypothetical protein